MARDSPKLRSGCGQPNHCPDTTSQTLAHSSKGALMELLAPGTPNICTPWPSIPTVSM